MSGFDVGDWVIARVPPAFDTHNRNDHPVVGQQIEGEVWEGEVERVEKSSLGGTVLTIRQSDSTVKDIHDRFCIHVRRPLNL